MTRSRFGGVFLAAAWLCAGAQSLNSIPDVTLVNEHGKPVRLYTDVMGRGVVVVNFVFTTCTTICPPMGAVFGQLQRLLQERGHLGVRLVSISVDPETDTPEKLMAWGQKFHAGPNWTLLTGSQGDIDKVRQAFSSYTRNKSSHSSVAFIGNTAKGKWTTRDSLGQVEELYKAAVSLE